MSLGDRMQGEAYEHMVTCMVCKNTYKQVIEDQVPGFKMMSEDACPYCGNIAHRSMERDYINSKADEVVIKKKPKKR